jgi:hypothetical protein
MLLEINSPRPLPAAFDDGVRAHPENSFGSVLESIPGPLSFILTITSPPATLILLSFFSTLIVISSSSFW